MDNCPSGIKALITKLELTSNGWAKTGPFTLEEEAANDLRVTARENLEVAIGRKLASRDEAIAAGRELIDEMLDHEGAEGFSQTTYQKMRVWEKALDKLD